MSAISVLDQGVGVVSPVSTVTTRAPPPISSSPLGAKAMASIVLIRGLPCSAWANVAGPRSSRQARGRERFIRRTSAGERGEPCPHARAPVRRVQCEAGLRVANPAPIVVKSYDEAHGRENIDTND